MTSDVPTSDAILPVRSCGSYTFGHDVHFIQANLSLRDGVGAHQAVEKVGSDGTIAFADGSSVWHHNPARLRAALALAGGMARLGTRGVLRVASGEGAYYCFSVSQGPEPCRAETAEHRPGESVIEELLRRGGVVRSGLEVLNQMKQAEVHSDRLDLRSIPPADAVTGWPHNPNERSPRYPTGLAGGPAVAPASAPGLVAGPGRITPM